MKETFKSYMELLVSIALDPDTMQALEKSNGIQSAKSYFLISIFWIFFIFVC